MRVIQNSKTKVIQELTSTESGGEIEKVFLHLVKDGPERVAIETGQIDAIVDPKNGNVILLPAAQQTLIERKARLNQLFELSCDWFWEQDENYRFVSHEYTDVNEALFQDEDIIGKTLWELSADNMKDADWQPLRQQLEWRAVFRDLKVRCLDHAGKVHYLSISGTPVFDKEDQFKGYVGITRSVSEPREVEAKIRIADQYAGPTLDVLTAEVCLLDPAGVILLSNRAWRECTVLHTDIGASVTEGANYLKSCDYAGENGILDGVAVAAGIRQVIAKEREHFRYEYNCESHTGRRRFMLNVTSAAGDTAASAVVMREDITEQRRGEKLLRLESMVARCLSNAGNESAALKAVIRAICESQEWDCGRYFRLDPVAGVLSYGEAWGIPVAAVDQFLEKSRDLVFLPGAGLTGCVFQSGQPFWVQDGAQSTINSPTALAPETGGEGAFIFAIMSEDKAIGVLAFTSRRILPPDSQMLQVMQSIGSQLGRFIQRQQVLDVQRRSAVYFRKLTELSVDWYWKQDSDYRFTHYYGAEVSCKGEVLGKTWWELPDIVISDEDWIKHKAELDAHWSFRDFEFAAIDPDGKTRYYCISGEPVFDEAAGFIGYWGTGMDITERKVAEIALHESEASRRALIGLVPD